MVAEKIAPVIAKSDIAALDAAFERLRSACSAGPYPSRDERRDRLDRLERGLRRYDTAIQEAISADFGHRAHEETLLFEQFVGIEGIRHARNHLRRWMRPRRRPVAWWSLPGRAQLRYQPLGVIGIIVPWNYPLYLAVGPLTGALAAGNRVLVKMSEFTPRFGELFARVIAEAFSDDEVVVVNGGVDVARHFSTLPFDHLFFTGSTRVGREVMQAASANLTPVTLELGGKSPAIVTDEFSLEESARRIMYGKLANAGQTCVAPDYALVPEAAIGPFIEACRKASAEFYPTLIANPDYTSIVNAGQFERLQGYLADASSQGASLHALHPDATDTERRRISPIALTGVKDSMRVMQDEIFGPILPVVGYADLAAAIRYVNARPRPLALYYFGDAQGRDRVLQETISGGVTVNNTLFHVAQDNLPFGGVGPSGMGDYHGFAGFRTFSKARPVYLDGRLSGSLLLRPPYGRLFRAVLRVLYR
jgi:acyl-CoA reductase-like NAD-dependent aldehyde dehydrogenase